MSLEQWCSFKWLHRPTNFNARTTRAKLTKHHHRMKWRTALTSNESFFSTILHQSKRVSRDEFAINFGGIDQDVVEMLEGEEARAAIRDARSKMENASNLPSGIPRLRQNLEFGNLDAAPELARGEVSPVEATFSLPRPRSSACSPVC